MYRIEADRLIPGRGDPIPDGCVLLEEGEIRYAGPLENAPSTPQAETVSVPAVMPGMWDVHGHFMGMRNANLDAIPRTPLPLLAIRGAKDAERALQAGFTSIREVGGLGVYLAQAIDEGSLPGPHIYAAGSILSPTGGHADLHGFPIDVMDDFARRGGFLALCDGVPACLRAARMQLRRGARVVKVCASGGVMSEVDHPIHQQFSDEELQAIVEEAARADRVVAAHCHGKPGILAALRAGCRTVEHGSYLDEEAVELLLAKEALLVPTRFIIERLLTHAEEVAMPDYALRKMASLHDQHGRALKLAVKRGVRLAVGTDIFTSGGEGPLAWGRNGEELRHLVEAGLTPLQAIEAATANGPATLGPQAPRSGQLREGYDADVIALAQDPVPSVDVLTKPEGITHVWKAGLPVKAPPA